MNWEIRLSRFASVGHLDHGEPDDLFAALEAGLEDLSHGVFTQGLILHMHHGVVLLGVKGLAQGGNFGDAQLGDCLLYTSRCV